MKGKRIDFDLEMMYTKHIQGAHDMYAEKAL